jgi:hypothetical protein
LSSTKSDTTYFVSVVIITIFVITIMNFHLKTELVPSEHIVKINFTRNTEVNLEDIFDLMADIEKYPEVIPDNFTAVKIINRTENFVQAEEHVFEKGLSAVLIVNHIIIPYEQHSIYIEDGLAKKSQIVIDYRYIENKTRITVSGELYLRGILSVTSIIAQDHIQNKIEQTIVKFEKYLESGNNLQS